MPIPKPFQRRSITLQGSERDRTWKYVVAALVKSGDTLAQRGTVELVDFESRRPRILLTMRSGDVLDEHPELICWSFTSAETCGEHPNSDVSNWSVRTRCAKAPDHDDDHVSAAGTWKLTDALHVE